MNRRNILMPPGSLVACAGLLPAAVFACLDGQQPHGGDARLNLICRTPDKPGYVDLTVKAYNKRNQPIGEAHATVRVPEGSTDEEKAAAISRDLNNELPGTTMAEKAGVMADGTGEDMDVVSQEAKNAPQGVAARAGTAPLSRHGVTIRFHGVAAGHRWQSSSPSCLYLRFSPYPSTNVTVQAGDTPEVLAARVASAWTGLGLDARAVGDAVQVSDRWGRDITASSGIGLHDADMDTSWEDWE